MRLTQVNPTHVNWLLKGKEQMTKFSNLMGGLVQTSGKRSILPATLGLVDPNANPESMDMLTQPEKVGKQIEEHGAGITSKPPERFGEMLEDYKRVAPGGPETVRAF